MKYKQCKLIKTSKYGIINVISWIPEKFAKQDKLLKIKDDYGKWENGWRVKKVFQGIILDEDEIKKRELEYRHHRKITDI